MTVPTNVRDLDGHIVAKFCNIRDEREKLGETDFTSEDIKFMLSPATSVSLGEFVQAACANANVEYNGTVLYELKDQAADDYVDAFNSGPQRRSILFKMAADVRDIIATLPQIQPKPMLSDEIADRFNIFDLGDIDKFIDPATMQKIQKSLQAGAGIIKKYGIDPDVHPLQKKAYTPPTPRDDSYATPFEDVYQTLLDEQRREDQSQSLDWPPHCLIITDGSE